MKPLTERQYLDLYTEWKSLCECHKIMTLRAANGLPATVIGDISHIENLIESTEQQLLSFETAQSGVSKIVLVKPDTYRGVELLTMSAQINRRASKEYEEEINICKSWANYLGFENVGPAYLARITVERLGGDEPVCDVVNPLAHKAESAPPSAASEPTKPETPSDAR